MTRAALALALAVAGGAAKAYDGPAGVTLIAPWIGRGALAREVRLERLEVASRIAVDAQWDPAQDARGRAFPDRFVATVATTRMRLDLANAGAREVRARLVVPFRASATAGTGFVAPESFAASLDGRPLPVPPAPRELQRIGMLAVRGYPIDVPLAAGAAAVVEIAVRHRLAVNPAWYRFEAGSPPLPRDTAHRFRVLADARTVIALALAADDPAVADRECTVQVCRNARCSEYPARFAELGREWFTERLPAGGLGTVSVNWR
jgi:hypothetical protein